MPKCQDCGLLSVKATNGQFIANGRAFLSPNKEYRETAIVVQELSDGSCGYEPVCLVGVVNYREKFVSVNKDDKGRVLALELIQKEIDCDRSVPWIPGFTPKEHLQMYREEKLREKAEQRLEEDKKWHAKMAEDRNTWEAEQRKLEREWREKQSRNEMFWRWVYGIAASLFAAGLAYYMNKALGITMSGLPIK